MPTTKKGVMERRQVTLVTLDPKLTLSVVKKKSRKASTLRDFLAEREDFELFPIKLYFQSVNVQNFIFCSISVAIL